MTPLPAASAASACSTPTDLDERPQAMLVRSRFTSTVLQEASRNQSRTMLRRRRASSFPDQPHVTCQLGALSCLCT